MRDFFLNSPLPGTFAWVAIYISDFVLTITCARLYDRNMSGKLVLEGSFELNPLFQRDVDTRTFLSLRFLIALTFGSILIPTYWVLIAPSSPGLYTFVLGAAISAELAVHIRHLKNLYLFSSRLTGEQVHGRIEYARPLILRMSSVEILGFVILFAVVFAFTGSWFAAGGMVSCSVLSLKHWYLAWRASVRRSGEAGQLVSR